MAFKNSHPKVISSLYQQDFVYHELPEDPRKERLKAIDPLSKLKTPSKPIQYDLSSLSQLREDVYVPFGLLHRRKELVQTDPHAHIPEAKLADIFFENKLKARKVRPRVYKIPQISLDDVDENVMYKGEKPLADYIYSTQWAELSKFCEKHAFAYSTNANSNSITKFNRRDILDKSLESTRVKPQFDIPDMEFELKKYANEWENIQPKHWIDTTEMFWNKNKQLGLCTLCDPPPKHLIITDEEQDEIDKCTKNNSFSLAYTLMHSSYTGCQSNCPVGVPYSKKIFKKHDPYVTTLMAMQGVYQKDNTEKLEN